jgi:hypothetical protein
VINGTVGIQFAMFCASLYVLLVYDMPHFENEDPDTKEAIKKIETARKFLPASHAILVLINWVTSNSRI